MNLKNIKSFRDLFLAVDKICYEILMKKRTTFIMQKDWDNLIILDACRYDMFRKVNFLSGKMESIYSRGSSTNHFLAENFKGKYFPDTVYITANPLVDYYVKDCFYRIISVWKEGWDDKYQTVLPGSVVDSSLKADRDFPDKRLIIHFMQPHFPFLAEKSRKIIGDHEGIMSRNLFYGKKVEHTQTVWHFFRMGKLSREIVWDAYVENLKIVLESVKELLEKLKGKTVITADHANLFGEWLFPFPLKEYGHHGGILKRSLIKVPWLIIDKEERKNICIGKDMKKYTNEDYETKEFAKKLEALGYL